MADGQPKASAATGQIAVRIGLGKGQKQALLVICANTDATVLNRYLQDGLVGRGARFQGQVHGDLALLGELDRVADQVRQDLLEAQRVEQHLTAGLGGNLEAQVQILLSGHAIEHAADRFHQFRQVDRFRRQAQVPGLDARHVEDIADQGQQFSGRVVGNLNGRTIDMPLVTAREGKFEHADDGVHRCADLVADGRQEDTLGAIGVIGPLLGQAQVLDQLAALADVDPAANNALHLAE
ncbi:hypothetical protein D9M71_534930 [compost metagenome]